ncbi:MAG: hypothetical protein GY914_05460 [Prochlorococcus sp.]|nr:hypothetical protein [Prochlorococcus sp.]
MVTSKRLLPWLGLLLMGTLLHQLEVQREQKMRRRILLPVPTPRQAPEQKNPSPRGLLI